VTVLEGIQRSTEFLTRKGVNSPRLHAELLLAHVLNLERMRLYLNFERLLSTDEANTFKSLVIRRGEREPLQQITGSTNFCGFEIAVNRAVLVPRPETELLAEKAVESLKSTLLRQKQFGGQEVQSQKAEADISEHALNALDLGTGSGCLAIALAKNCDLARVVATDVSPEALECAKANALKNSVADRIEFRLGNSFQTLKAAERFDLIVSNPPYIPTSEIESLQSEVKDWEPRLALDGGPDGLDWYRRIASEAEAFLAPGGKVILEFGDGQSEAIRNVFENEKWIVEAIIEDYTRRPRIMAARRQDS
jgi:release factor glutamine methyltransferase